MNLCKRYVKEFATDALKAYKTADGKTTATYAIKKTVVDRYIELCEYGYISNTEAIRKIMEEVSA